MLRASKDREQLGSSSVDYLMYSGFVMMACFWALEAAKATELLASGKGKESKDFYPAKNLLADWPIARVRRALPPCHNDRLILDEGPL
jgi:hypothetical protein